MTFRGDDRAVTVQIGAILLFGILIIALATVQVTIVPDENAATEFEHNLDAQRGVTDLRNALLAAGRSGDPASASVRLGTTYEQRTFLINPPPARGTIRTVGTGDPAINVTLDNAAADSPYDNAEAYWNGTPRTFDTGHIVYTPNYNEYREAPITIYEHSLVANVFSENRTLERSGQTLIRGNRINLLTVNGTLQENGVTAESVDARPLSAYENTVTVRSGNDPLWVNITSRLSAESWENRVLAEQATDNGGNVVDVVEISNRTRDGVTYHRVGIKLASNTTYELRGASVAVGAVAERNQQPEPTYLVVTDEYQTVGNGSTGKLTVQVRDQFNNPVEDFTVNGTLDTEYLQFVDENGNEVDSISVTTDADGYATFTYKGVKTTGADTTWLNVSMLGGGEAYQSANFTGKKVPVFATGGGDGGGDLVNPGSSGEVILTDAQIGTDTDRVILTLNNTDSTTANLSITRVEFYYSAANNYGYTEVAIANGTHGSGTFPTAAAVMQIGGSYESLDPKFQIAPGESTVTLEFRPKSVGGPGGNNQITQNEFFIVTFVYEVDGEQVRYRYFVRGQ